MKHFRRHFVFAASVLLLAQLALGQGFQIGGLSGTVTDESGGVLPGVSVTATHQERGNSRTEVTDAEGKFRFVQLPLGPYRVEAALSGFETQIRNNVRVEMDKNSVVDIRLNLAATASEITVTAEAPIVDPTNVTQTTNVSAQEFEKAPIGRSYQTIAALAPGITATSGGNPYANGALSSSNQFLYDGVDVTDPTTGTFGANLNFEAIQEISVLTTGVSAEYGRAQGAVINVVTKSGTNEFDGSLKIIGSNDKYNEQNKTKNSLTGTSFARTKTDFDNIRYAGTLGGPILRDRAFFFGAYEEFESMGAPGQTYYTEEDFNSQRFDQLQNYRLNVQITPSHQIWGRYGEDPATGIVREYYPANDLFTLTNQNQGGDQLGIQYSGVIGSNLALEGLYGKSNNIITVEPYRKGPYDNGSVVYDLDRATPFLGGQFDYGNGVDRPREQIVAAATYYTDLAETTHDFKLGYDTQEMASASYYSYTNNRMYRVRGYDPATQTWTTPVERRDYDNLGPQRSEGEIQAIYVRDKMTLGPRLFVEAGVRFEDQGGSNDIGEQVIDAQSLAPRLAATYDLLGDGKNILSATAGRYYDFIIQSFVDGFAETSMRANYDRYLWNTTTKAWDFSQRVILAGGSTLQPNLDLEPGEMDELTVGFQRQLGRTMGLSVRAVMRDWDNLIDDAVSHRADKSIQRNYVNSDDAYRQYRSLQATFDKRFSNRWSFLANYTYSETKGNHFSTTSSVNGDYMTNNCRSTDTTVGTIPCSQVWQGYDSFPNYDRPHVLNALGTYAFDLGPVNLTLGMGGYWNSGLRYSKAGTVTLLYPDGASTGSTYTYYYGKANDFPMPDTWSVDNSIEATFDVWQDIEIGLKGEIFNTTNQQDALNNNRTAWCADTSTACQTRRNEWGAQTSRDSFRAPRSYRITGLIRF